MSKLFESEKVKKFFRILDKLSGNIPINTDNYPWKGYQTIYTKDSNHVPSTREVFVHRTINKWLRSKALIIYRTSDLEIEYKQYININSISYQNSWSGKNINVKFMDYTNPYDSKMFTGEDLCHNDIIDLEGEWCENINKHLKILNLITMNDIPDKEYIFKAYDWYKYPKNSKNTKKALEKITTTKSFIAKTERQAYRLRKIFADSEENSKFIISDLIEIKKIKT